MKHLFSSLLLTTALLGSFAASAQTTTGAYCTPDDKITSFFCNGPRPDASWNASGDSCWARQVRGSCTALKNTSPVFDNHQYGVINGDVAQAGTDRLNHWQNSGIDEGRRSSLAFSVQDYVTRNGDLQSAFGTNWRAALDHYVKNGIWEGRLTVLNEAAPSIPVLAYNPGEGFVHPKDAQMYWSIMRFGDQTDAQLSTNTHYDTTPITGLPNTFGSGSGSNLKAPYQNNWIDSQWGFNGVQNYGGQFGVALDSRPVKDAINTYSRSAHAAGKVADEGLVTTSLSRFWPDTFGTGFTPFNADGSGPGLKTSVEYRVPFSGGTASCTATCGAQMGTTYFLRNKVKNATLTLIVNSYDTRINQGEDIRGFGGFDIFTVRLKKGTPYITVPAWSAEDRSGTFTTAEHYEFTVNYQNMQAIIARALQTQVRPANQPNLACSQIPNALCSVDENSKPEDFEVSGWIFGPEVYSSIDNVGNFTGDGWIGVSGRVITAGTP